MIKDHGVEESSSRGGSRGDYGDPLSEEIATSVRQVIKRPWQSKRDGGTHGAVGWKEEGELWREDGGENHL